jgi:hypothetical protein
MLELQDLLSAVAAAPAIRYQVTYQPTAGKTTEVIATDRRIANQKRKHLTCELITGSGILLLLIGLFFGTSGNRQFE